MKTHLPSTFTPSAAFGLTRVELLATMGVLAVLAMIHMAGCKTHQADAQTAVCLGNLHRLANGWSLYAADHDGWFPPNPDSVGGSPGQYWVYGNAGLGGREEFSTENLRDPKWTVIAPYIDFDPLVFRCPLDARRGRDYLALPFSSANSNVPAARAVSANGAVGTEPFGSPPRRSNGAWLDGEHNHTAGMKWRTYGRLSDMTDPSPGRLFLLIEEDVKSINDGHLAVSMVGSHWIDWPATRHNRGAVLSFGDGHVEWHHWTDPRTEMSPMGPVPGEHLGSRDIAWLQARTTALIDQRK